jgi:hypothetical protein
MTHSSFEFSEQLDSAVTGRRLQEDGRCPFQEERGWGNSKRQITTGRFEGGNAQLVGLPGPAENRRIPSDSWQEEIVLSGLHSEALYAGGNSPGRCSRGRLSSHRDSSLYTTGLKKIR